MNNIYVMYIYYEFNIMLIIKILIKVRKIVKNKADIEY
jgi:hypothetical protein